MNQYFLMTNEEAAVPSSDSWMQQQEQLGCYGCRRVLFPRVVNVEVEYASSFSKLTTKSSRASNIRSKLGVGIAIVSVGLAEAMGMDALKNQFFVGTVSCQSLLIPYYSLVPIRPQHALRVGSLAPLDIIRCSKSECSSAVHAFGGAPSVEAENLTESIYAVDCRVDSFVVDTATMKRVRELNLTEVVLEPLNLVSVLPNVI